MRILSLIPPMTQLNTPYPSTAYLTGFLRGLPEALGIQAHQADLALGLVLETLTPQGLEAVAAEVRALPKAERNASTRHFLDRLADYQAVIGPLVGFLQGRNPTLAHRIASRTWLPEGPRFAALDGYPDDGSGDPLGWAFGALGLQDRARHIATLVLNDLADVLKAITQGRFEFVRYAESLAGSQPTFEPLARALAAPANLLDRTLQRLTHAVMEQHRPEVVLLSVPFPGSVYGALRIAQEVRRHSPACRIVLGGGYVNTELRSLSDPGIFDFVDYICLDAGERPILALLEHLQGRRSASRLIRTYTLDPDAVGLSAAGRVVFHAWAEPDVPFAQVGTPTWDGLPMDSYLSLLDLLNPMNRLWSDGRWNKITVAHGCYWKKCSFCDVSLDYIGRYEAIEASLLVDRMEALIAETGQTGFHLVDEAAPPKALKAMAQEILRRGLAVSWWGNIRFEKTFTPELVQLLAQSGCIAVTGGLEVASDRLLALMNKGVTVDQVARVTHAFSEAGVLVHAYLMYGFPTQTLQDTVDALELVRQLFWNGCIQSGFFHRFVCTVHSPVGLSPEDYGVELRPLPEGGFAKNDVGFIDPTGTDHDRLGTALKKALYNYMHGVALEDDVRGWFAEAMPEVQIPRPTVGKQRIARALAAPAASRPAGPSVDASEYGPAHKH